MDGDGDEKEDERREHLIQTVCLPCLLMIFIV